LARRELIARHPRVFHTMSAARPSVQRHGLLSTRRMIDFSTSTPPGVTGS